MGLALTHSGTPSHLMASEPFLEHRERGEKGAVYVFERGGWNEVAKLTVPDSFSGDRFGEAVAIHGDTIFVGAPSRGEVYIFELVGSVWNLAETIIGLPGSLAGASLAAATSNGDRIFVIGAPNRSNEEGAVTVFRNSGSGWAYETRLHALDPQPGDRFFIGTLRV